MNKSPADLAERMIRVFPSRPDAVFAATVQYTLAGDGANRSYWNEVVEILRSGTSLSEMEAYMKDITEDNDAWFVRHATLLLEADDL